MKKTLFHIMILISFFILTAFNIDNATVPKNEILSGGPPKDGIPALLEPDFVKPDEAGFMDADDSVIGVSINGESKAYSTKILNWHEVVNDTVGGEPIAVTF